MFRTIFTTLRALLKSGLCAIQLYPRSDTSYCNPPVGLSASKTLVSTLETSSRTKSEDPKRTPKLVKLVAKPQMAAVSSRSRKPLSSQRTMVALFMEAELSTSETRNQTHSSRALLFAQVVHTGCLLTGPPEFADVLAGK